MSLSRSLTQDEAVGVLRLRPQFAILRRNELLKMLDGVDMVQHVAALHHFSGRESGVGR
jgi:hypothetical protein